MKLILHPLSIPWPDTIPSKTVVVLGATGQQVVTDASASFTKIGDDAALRRMEQAGAVITSTAQIISELAIDWTTPRGQTLSSLLGLGV